MECWPFKGLKWPAIDLSDVDQTSSRRPVDNLSKLNEPAFPFRRNDTEPQAVWPTVELFFFLQIANGVIFVDGFSMSSLFYTSWPPATPQNDRSCASAAKKRLHPTFYPRRNMWGELSFYRRTYGAAGKGCSRIPWDMKWTANTSLLHQLSFQKDLKKFKL